MTVVEEIRQSIDEYRQYSTKFSSDLRKTADFIEQGGFIDEKQHSSLSEKILMLKIKAKECVGQIISITGVNEIKNLSDAGTAIKAYEENEKNKVKKKELLNIADRFKMLVSNDEKAAKALDKTNETLAAMISNDSLSCEDLECTLVPYKKLTEAVEITDIGERARFAQQLDGTFSDEIITSVIFGKIVKEKQSKIESDNEVSTALETAHESVTESEQKEELVTKPASQEKTEVGALITGGNADNISESETETEQTDEYEEITEKADDEIEVDIPDDAYGFVFSDFNDFDKFVTKSYPVSQYKYINFMRDAQSGDHTYMLKILMFMRNHCIMSDDNIKTFSQRKNRRNNSQSGLKTLLSGGYIKRITSERFGSFYLFTQKGADVFKDEKAVRLMKKYGPVDVDNDVCIIETDNNDEILALVLSLKMEDILSHMFENYEKISNSKAIGSGFSVCKFTAGERKAFYSGAVLHSVETVSTIVRCSISDKAEFVCEAYDIAVYGSVDLQNAKAVQRLWSENGVKAKRILYYTLDGMRLYEKTEDGYTETVLPEPFETDATLQSDDSLTPESGKYDLTENEKLAEVQEAADTTANNKADAKDDAEEPENLKKIEKPVNVQIKPDYKDIKVTNEPDINISVEKARADIYNMLIKGKPYCAVVYAKSAAIVDESIGSLSERLSYALDEPSEVRSYSSFNLFNVFDEKYHDDEFYNYCYLAAIMRSFFYHDEYGDYDISNSFDMVKNSDIFEDAKQLKEFINMAYKFKKDTRMGMDKYAGYRLKDKSMIAEKIERLSVEANNYYDNYVLNPGQEKKSQRRYIETRDSIFGRNNVIGECLNNLNEDFYEEIKEKMVQHFVKDGMPVRQSSIDENKINSLINKEWDMAGSRVAVDHKTWALTAGLRNKLTNRIRTVVSVICEWVYYMSLSTMNGTDKAETVYDQQRDTMISHLSAAVDEMNRIISRSTSNTAVCAGASVVRDTAHEILRRVKGDYNETEHKYFYAEFLKSGYIPLDSNFVPDSEAYFYDLPGFTVFDRINAAFESETCDVQEHVVKIFEETDDFGFATLIKEYLDETGQSNLWDEGYNIEQGERLARPRADSAFEDFQGTLELFQSYGQIESIDEKEKVLAVVQWWYNYSINTTHNYGFFVSMMEKYKDKIRHDGEVRGRALERQFEDIINVHKEYEVCEIAEEIRRTLGDQNYTVAEEYIRKLQNGETKLEGTERYSEMNYLEEFYNEYERYYDRIARSAGTSLKQILHSNSKRNKDTKGANALIENWISGNGTSCERIKNLLERLGFNALAVEKEENINGKYDCYMVRIIDSKSNRTYPHTVAAFGSEAELHGFHVICIFGTTNSDRLIEELCGVKDNAIVLVDYALADSERSRLARLMKQRLSSHIFLVIDRVMISYLANHYEDTAAIMQRKLMMIAMPFSYYQPYISESSIAKPPEMFFGRRYELESIKDPKGANMIFGGRQLGKSALLEKARSDVEDIRRGHRAVLIDIRNKDYADAALVVSGRLADMGILEKGSECNNWNELGRHIYRRLNPIDGNRSDIEFLLLMMDEADRFIASSKETDYEPFRILKNLQTESKGRFKFVVAGLRDLVKFHHEIGENNIMLHMKPITIKAFTSHDAEELLEKPLIYFGMRFPKEKHYLVSLILATANYFPGLIQLYCSKLIEAFKENDYAGYNEGSSPPYEIDVNLIKKVLSDKEFREEINEKLEMTLRLDSDDYYFIFAIIMAYLYDEEGYEKGHTAEHIRDTAEFFGITKISELSIDKVISFMTELEDLNVFRHDNTGGYLFSRHNFYQMLKSSYNIEDEVLKLEG